MKTLNLKFSFLLLFFMLFNINLSAATVVIDTDTFDSTTDGWSGTGEYWDAGQLSIIGKNKYAIKTFSFPSLANKTVTFTLEATEDGSWSSYDKLYIRASQQVVINRSINGTEILTFNSTLNSLGLTEILILLATYSNYKLSIDNIEVTYTYPQIAPTLASEKFEIFENLNIGDFVGTVSSTPAFGTPYAPSFSIISGDTDSLFAIDNNGNITTTADLTTRSTDTYILNIKSTNDFGTVFANITIEIEDAPESNDGRDFEIRTQYNLFGDVKVIGNTVLCVLTSGVCDSNVTKQNNYLDLKKVPESYSTLNLPSTATVEYARIYWQGRQAADSDTDWDDEEKEKAGKIKLKKGSSGEYLELIADVQDFSYTHATNNIRTYSSSADASRVVDSNGTYYVDTNHFFTNEGATDTASPKDDLGNYGAWVLVVVYSDKNSTKARNITIFDGYKTIIKDHNVNINVSGFLTPKTGLVDSKTYIFVAEGDFLGATGDTLNMAGATYNTTMTKLGTFDSRIDLNATRSPNLSNNNGIDIHVYNTGTTPGAKNIITNDETGAIFNLTSDLDTYFPSALIFSTEVYLPQMCYDYSIKQDGSYLSIDRDTYPVAHLNSTISSSDLEITVYLKNLEADIVAEGIAIKSDVNSSIFTHSGNIFSSNVNGSILIDRGIPDTSTSLCDYDKDGNNSVGNSGCTDGSNIRKGMGTLEDGDYVYTKFTLKPLGIIGLQPIDEPLGLSIKYYITAGGNKIEYPDYELGSINVPICVPDDDYDPSWGIFNVVQNGQPNDEIKNNIYTQISRNPFNMNVVFDSSPDTGNNEAPTSDINTTVMVEIIDIDAFGEIDTSCANPDSSLSTPIFVPIEFNSSYFQTPISTQPADYYNFAVKNASFRIWYFADTNGTLIQNWTATVDTNNTNVSSISGLYQSELHSVCEDSCSISTSATSTDCFNCIRANYAQPLCSRDNFSVRPESYNVKIYDINHTASTAVKDSTKFNISVQDGFDPDSAQTSQRMNLAAGYNYRFDIDATGYDGINTVPGYTRSFNGGADYNATMIWDSQTAGLNCNDNSDVALSFYIANGAMINKENNHTNVGQYKINIIDKSWTAVDNTNRAHHISTDSFDTDPDCHNGDTTTIPSAGRYGCDISTDHGSDNGGRYYQDHDVDFHPYKFNMTNIIASHGIENNTIFNADTFIYMADMLSNSYLDQNMSFRLNGAISAQGKDGSTLSNFVDNCFAKQIDLSINRSNVKISSAADHRFVFHNADISTNEQNGSMNNLSDTITLNTDDFNKSNNGSVNTILNLNFDRNVSTVQNPETLTFTNYKVFCNNPANDCTMNAELNSAFETKGNMDLNQTGTNTNITINYLYARSHATRNRFSATANQEAFIYYEVYCDGTIEGNPCDKDLLPNGIDSNTTDDPRWFVNENHTSNYGNAGNVNQKGYAVGSGFVTQDTAPTGNHQDRVELTYDESKGLPYKTTMQINSSNWLIYNKYDKDATVNEFKVEYGSDDTSWGGKAETNSTTIEGGASDTNRRFMW